MFSKLADKAIGFLGLTYVATGLVPALLVVVIASLYGSGDSSALATFIGAISKGEVKPDHLTIVLALVAVSVLFYLFAPGFVSLYSEPFWFWEWPRSAMAARQRAKLEKLRKKILAEEARFSAMERYFHANDGTDYYIPPELDRPGADGVQRDTARAAKALGLLEPGRHASYDQRREIEEAIAGMYMLRRGTSTEEDTTSWLQWRSNEKFKDAIALAKPDIEADILRRMTALLEEREGFPPPDEMHGTRLGNVLAAIDAYCEQRHKIPGRVLLDRLWWLLGKDPRGDVASGQTRVQVLVECSFVMLAAALFIGGREAWLAYASNQDSARMAHLFWGVVWSGVPFTVSLLLYNSAVRSAEALSQLVRSVFDTQVLALVRAMGFAPKTAGELAELLTHLRVFFVEGLPLPESLALELKGSGTPKDGNKPAKDDEP